MTAVLEVQDLAIGFGDTTVVHGVDLTLERGETLALVGESGCGKSLTAFAIMGLLPKGARVSRGRVAFSGADLVRASPRALRDVRGRRIGLILQDPTSALDPVMTIGDQVGEVIRRHERLPRAAVRRRVLELLELVGVAEPQRRIDEYPHNFSGGMRQRVMIATAIACRPDLVIADEPTTALDVTIQAQVLDLLDGLRRQLGMAILLITHDLGVVAQWADRVAVMYAGRVVEQAPVRRFFAAPSHPYSRGLLAASVEEDGAHYTSRRLTEIAGSVQSAAGEPGCSFAPRCPDRVPACHVAPPPLEPIGPQHRAACIRIPATSEPSRVTALG